jgi:hypothetical protein
MTEYEATITVREGNMATCDTAEKFSDKCETYNYTIACVFLTNQVRWNRITPAEAAIILNNYMESVTQ